MNSKHLLSLAMAGALLNACAHQPQSTGALEKTSAPTAASQANSHKEHHTEPSLLEFISNFSELSLELQKKELAAALQKSSNNNNDLQQKTRIAIIYSIPGSKLRDPLKAQPLLDELAREKQLSKEESAIVSILRDNAAETTKLNQRLREELRRAEENQQKANGLQQKLDELKKIERTMMQKSLKDPNRSGSK
ncbi:hypothetical protein ACIKP9_01190 [Methylobacillus methanolivorans]|uniref:Uncharacterized protein n=1 Tax=Methylobacillus methanolivorans TaxID=1848927 RepID=A0ABW8GHI5_9PROT